MDFSPSPPCRPINGQLFIGRCQPDCYQLFSGWKGPGEGEVEGLKESEKGLTENEPGLKIYICIKLNYLLEIVFSASLYLTILLPTSGNVYLDVCELCLFLNTNSTFFNGHHITYKSEYVLNTVKLQTIN